MRTRHDAAVRQFRLWDAKAKKDLPHRYYSVWRNAHLGALVEARWGKVGTTVEVYDCTTGKLHGQYTRTPTSVAFQGA